MKEERLVAAIWRFALVASLASSIILAILQTAWGVRAVSAITPRHGSLKAPLMERPFFDRTLIVATDALVAQLQQPQNQTRPVVLQWFIKRDNTVAGLLHYQLYPRGIFEQFLDGYAPPMREKEVPRHADPQETQPDACRIEWRSESDVRLFCPGSAWRYQTSGASLR